MNKILNMTKFTFLKLVKNKILYGIFFLNLIFIYLLKGLNLFEIGAHPLVIIDSTLYIYEIMGFILLLAVIANNIRREIETKNIYLVLSKPVTKVEYILGKIFGIYILFAIFTLLTIIEILIFMSPITKEYTGLFILAIIFKAFYLFIFTGILIFFSLFLRPTIMVVISIITFYFAGLNLDYIELIIGSSYPSIIVNLLKFIKFILPNGNYLDLRFAAMQLTNITFSYFIASILYIIGYMGFIVLLSGWIFKNKEF